MVQSFFKVTQQIIRRFWFLWHWIRHPLFAVVEYFVHLKSSFKYGVRLAEFIKTLSGGKWVFIILSPVVYFLFIWSRAISRSTQVNNWAVGTLTLTPITACPPIQKL